MTVGRRERTKRRQSERARRSQAPRFIGLLPILSRAQNAAKHGETVCERIYTAVSRITRRYRHGKQPPVIYQLNLSCHASNKGIRTIRCCLLSSLPIHLNLSLSLSLSHSLLLLFSLFLSIYLSPFYSQAAILVLVQQRTRSPCPATPNPSGAESQPRGTCVEALALSP